MCDHAAHLGGILIGYIYLKFWHKIPSLKSIFQQPAKKPKTSLSDDKMVEYYRKRIDELLDKRIFAFESGLRRDFPDYDDYPEEVKLGLMDMAFNLGNSGLVNKFPSFTRAAREKDWAGCAKECHRNGIADSRNQEVEDLFTSVA